MDLELGLCMTKNLLSQPFGCVRSGSSRISIPMAWISFGNRVHFPLFFTSSLNISQTYFGKIVLRMIETVRRCQQCEMAFIRNKRVRKHFDSISHVQAFKIPKDFGLWQLFLAAHRPTEGEEWAVHMILYILFFLQRPMLQQIWVNSHPCIIFLTLFSLTFWPAGLRALVLRIKQICKTEIQRAS